EVERRALQRAVYGLARDLLPPSPSFAVPHQEVLVVDTREIEMQRPSLDCSRPHQTGVTKRSISDDDRLPPDGIVQNVMVSHLADGISARVLADGNGHDHFFGVELALRLREELNP